MSEATIQAEVTPPAGPGLLSRIVGVFLSPRETYAAVAARPRVFGVFAVALLIMAGAQAAFLSTDVGKEALLDQQVSFMESFGRPVTDEMYANMQRQVGIAPYTTAGSTIVIAPIVTAIVAGLLLVVFNAFLGGEASYKQIYAVMAHSSLIGALQQLFNLPINFATGEMGSATRLSVFFPMLEEMSFVTYLLSAIDLFIIWSVVNTAIGLAVLYKRRTGPIAAALLGVYAVIAVIIASVRS